MILTPKQMFFAILAATSYYALLYFADRSLPASKRRFARPLAMGLTYAAVAVLWTRYVAPDGVNLFKIKPAQVALGLVGLGTHGAFCMFVHQALPERARAIWRYIAAAGSIGLFFFFTQEVVPDHKRAVEISKAALAITAAAFVFYEQHRQGQQRPLAERWKKFIWITLALAAITTYFNGFRFGYPRYYHRWDQYHYYMGAKYFPELGYKDLYKCGVVAQDEIGVLKHQLDRPWGSDNAPNRSVDMRKEMRDPDKKVRNLRGENLLVPARGILQKPEECRDQFSTERWEEYKADVAFFRITSGKGYWTDMQKDHGFNPPPVWTIMGKFFADLSPTNVQYMQFLASIDVLYLLGMFVALYWGFGWRVFAVGAIFWGCQSSAPFYWTGGAFLRQDWLFFSVLSVACLRKRNFKIAGAALVYAGLLRIFPGLVVIGTLVPTITYALKHKRMHRDHQQMLLGGCMAAAVLLPLSVAMCGTDAYKTFYEHTIETHDQTPLTNHMGLRVMIGHKFIDFQKPGLRNAEEAAKAAGPNANSVVKALARVQWPFKVATGKTSGHMRWVRNNRLVDPFETWKTMRNERYHKYRYLAYGIILASLAFFVMVVRKIKSLWVAQCLGQIFVILLSQLTCYYYSFMILAAPLLKLKRRKQVELGLFGLAAITQIIWMYTTYNDHRYTLLTYASFIWCLILIGMFWRRQPQAESEYDDEGYDDDEDEDVAAATT